MAEDVLTQLGVNLPPLPETDTGTVGNQATPTAEAMEAPNMSNLEDFADNVCLTCFKALEQVALPSYITIHGANAEKSKAVVKILSILEKIVPEEKTKDASNKDLGSIIGELLGGAGGAMPQGMPTPTPTAMPQAPSGAVR